MAEQSDNERANDPLLRYVEDRPFVYLLCLFEILDAALHPGFKHTNLEICFCH